MNSATQRRLLPSLLAVAGAALMAWVALPPAAEAVQIKAVYSGTLTFDNIDVSNTAILPATVDTSKSIIYLTPSTVTSNKDQDSFYYSYFEDNRTINVTRGGASVAGHVTWHVIEFADGVNVQRGLSSMDNVTKIKTITLPSSFDNTKAFPIVQVGGALTTTTDTEIMTVKASFPSSTSIQLERLRSAQDAGQTKTITIAYQVVEFLTDATVKTGSLTIAYNATSGTATVSPAITDTTKAFLITTYSGNGTSTGGIDGIDDQLCVRGAITDATTLTFTRASSSSSTLDTVDVIWYLVEMTDSVPLVQSGATTLGTGATGLTGTGTLGTSVDYANRVWPILSFSGQAGGNNSSMYDDLMTRAIMTNGTTLSFTREATSYSVTLGWQAVEFGPLTLKAPNGGEVWKVGESRNITWKHALSVESGGLCGGTNHCVDLLLSTDGGSTYPLTIVSGLSAAADTYAWTIPATIGATNLIGATLRVKIADTTNTTRSMDVSNANFEIKGTVTVTAPNSGETWSVGDTNRNITWNKTGDLSYTTFSLYLSEDGGATYPTAIATALTQAASCTGNACSYAWNPIPDKVGSDRRVQVYIASDAAGVVDTSDANFNVKGVLSSLVPNGGESWPAQTSHNITWTKNGTFTNFDLSYSTNSGGTYPNTIVTGLTQASACTGNSCTYAWTVPTAAISTFCRVKVVGNQAGSLQTTLSSAADFSIVPSLKVTSPDTGAELWRVGESRNITWNVNGSIATVKLEYSTDGGTTWVATPIATGVTASSGTYAWTIPDAIGDSVRVKVSDEAAPATRFDASDNNFKIRGKITVSVPNGGEVWTVGSSQVISFTKAGSFGNVDLLYSTDGGTTFPTTIATNQTGTTYSWTVPDAINSTVRVRVRATNALYQGDTFDDSDANFAIKPLFTVTAPNGGETWNASTTQTIIWNNTGSSLGNVKLEYSTDGGTTYPNVISASTLADTDPPTGANNGQFSWSLPTTTGTQFRVKLTWLNDTTVYDTSNANFTVKGTLTVTAPNGPETGANAWIVGQSKNITWTVVGGIANVKLEYSKNAFADETQTTTIVASTPAAAQSYAWTVPDAIGANVKVRITDAADAAVTDVSDAPFEIKGSVTVTAPNGGQTWIVGSTQNITWTMTGTLGNVKLEYSTNAFADELQTTVITASTTADTAPTGDGAGSYSWLIPDAIGSNLKVRVSHATDATVKDVSDLAFTIKGSLTMTAPNGAEQWPINSAQNITWTKTGTLTGNLKLEYSTDAGVTYPVGNLISNTAPASSTSYAWTVADNPTAQGRIKVTYLNDAGVNDQSDANFSIKGSLVITSPNTAVTWIVGESRNITWTKGGAIANAKLDYSTDGGATYPNSITASTPAANLSYAWTVPDAIGTQLRVRITDVGDATVNDASDANFAIKGSLTLTYPNGGENLVVGNAAVVTWNKTGTIANVKLEYSKNAFADELQTFTIVASTPGETDPPTGVGNGQYTWTVPDAMGTNLKVRVTNLADTAVTDVSDAAFTIKGSVTLTAPNGAETWIVGESRNVTWTMTGSIANMKLEYSKNGFVDESQTFTIIASTPAETDPPTGLGSGQYAWTVADAMSSTVKVRVTNTADATVTDKSDANFTIKGKLTLTAPNGAEAWLVGTSQNITWTRAGSIAFVKLEYSTDGGSTFPNVITTSTDADPLPADNIGIYAWTVPDAIGNTVKVRVTNTADTTVFDDSDANFKIKGGVTVTAPNGNEKWTVGSVQSITWTRTGSVANVKLEYSTDGGTTYPNLIIATTPASALSYSWTMPNNPSATVKVKISDVSDATVNDISDANFKIKASLTLTAPNGGEVWTVGSPQTITWTNVGTVSNVKLEYSTDGGLTYPNLIAASAVNTGSYSWSVPDAITTSARVKVTDAADADAWDASDANFKMRGALTVTAPNGGESWGIGTAQNIAWTRTGSIANVKLEYSTNGFSDELQTSVIVASTPADPLPADNAGTYAWTIPDAPSTTVKVRATDASDATVNDLSNANFSIKGTLTITAPNGAEVWIVGSSYNITWTKGGSIANVKLQYSTDSGTTWPDPGKVITASTAASTLSYTWTIPDDISNTVRVRLTSTADASVFDDSNANFSIKGSLTLTAPNGSEVWIVGSSPNIAWSKTGSIANVKLDYSTDGGTTYPNAITASVAATPSSYAWTIPDAISTTARVKITNVADSAVADTSDANFAIKGSLTLTSPNGGEVWSVGSAQPITWTKAGSIANVKLDYSTNGGTSYPNAIVASVAAASGSYNWTIPDAITTTARVKVTNVDDTAVFDASDANFKIAGSLTVTAPNGGEKWAVGTSQNITWTKTGSIASVKLEYSTDGGVTYPNLIAASVDATLGTPYAWTIPDAPTTSARVKVTNTGDATVYDTSNANFKMQGTFTVTVPNGAETWLVNESRTITWTKSGSIANAKLEYSTDGGTTYPNLITASTAAANLAYSWVVPDAIGSSLRVKITDTTDPDVFDASNANFTVKGVLTVTAPNGGEVWTVGTNQNITWTRVGSVANVKLDYSTDGGVSYPLANVIAASVAGANLSYIWNVPDAIGTQLKVRASDTSDASVKDDSNGNFAIKGSLTVAAPNGGEAWTVGTNQNITWTKVGSIANVKLEYSTNGFVNETQTVVISASTPAAPLTYAWTVPDAIGTAVRVRASDASDATVSDTSNANFQIKGSLVITAPNGGENWVVGTTQTITWNRTGSIPNVKLDYSTDGGLIYSPIVASTGNTGSYAWVLPNTTTPTARVKVSDINDATVNDASDANFRVQAGFTITVPNGGENWQIGSSQTITWTTAGTVAFVKLDYSTNSGTTFPNLITSSTSNTGSYAWTIPDQASGTVRVRVSDTTDVGAYDTSNGDFRIRTAFTLTAPNGSEQWRVGEVRNITWSLVGTLAGVKLQYSRDNFAADIQSITASAPSTGSYAWTLPDAISNTVRVKVSDPNDIGAFKTSAADFRITGNFTVTAPNGAEQWMVGDTNNITWTKAGSITNAKVEYSTDGGATYAPIIGLTPNNGTYAWLIPNTISATCRVRISDPNDATANDISDANFKIKARVTVTAPNGGEVWTVGESRSITWTNTGTVSNVKLEYSTNSGVSYPNVIAASAANNLTYAWTIPDAISTGVRVKVSSATDVDAFDTSDADLKIRGALTVTAPNGSEAWKIASPYNITWATTGTIPTVKILYSTNGGTTYPNTIAASATNTGTYAWTIPDTPTTTAKMRIENTADATVFDESDATFKLQGGFTITSPNGGEVWTVAEARSITWTWGGTIPNVKLSYSTDGGATYPNLIAASAPNGVGSSGSFSYAWTVPDAISTTAKVKIEDPSDATVTDVSDANFKMQGKLVVTAPNGGERWVTNESRQIRWTTTGSIANVKLEYSTDGGATYPVANLIVASFGNAPGANVYNWTVPDNRSASSRVRVINVADNTVNDASDANFTIDYYNITWDIRDLMSNNALDKLSLTGTDGTVKSGQNAPVTIAHKYGAYTFTWSRQEYGDMSTNVVVDSDKTVQVFMETSVVHIWDARSMAAYDPATDTVRVSSSLVRDGVTITGATSCNVKFYDAGTLIKTLTSTSAPDALGIYNFTWSAPTGLTSGKVYNVVTTMTNATNGTFNTPSTFQITQEKKLQDVATQLTATQNTVDTKLDMSLTQMDSNIQTKLDAQKASIDSSLASQTTTLNTKLDAQTATITSTLTSFETKTDAAIANLNTQATNVKAAGDKVLANAQKYGIRLSVPPQIKLGDTAIFRFQAEPDATPLLYVYKDDGAAILSALPMTADSTRPGAFTYSTKIETSTYPAAKTVTIVVEETKHGGLEAAPMYIATTDLDAVLGVASKSSDAADYAKRAAAAAMAVQASLGSGGSIGMALQNLSKNVNDIPATIKRDQGSGAKQLMRTVDQIASQLKQLAGKEGYDLTKIVGKALDESSSLKDVRKKTDAVQGTTELMRKVMENKLGGIDAPVVHVIFE